MTILQVITLDLIENLKRELRSQNIKDWQITPLLIHPQHQGANFGNSSVIYVKQIKANQSMREEWLKEESKNLCFIKVKQPKHALRLLELSYASIDISSNWYYVGEVKATDTTIYVNYWQANGYKQDPDTLCMARGRTRWHSIHPIREAIENYDMLGIYRILQIEKVGRKRKRWMRQVKQQHIDFCHDPDNQQAEQRYIDDKVREIIV